MSRLGKSIEAESRLVMLRAGKVGEKQEITANGYDISFISDENVLKLDCCDGCTNL